ncbi:Protein T19D12.9 [Aphelenchoides avenae]|nr:Protein T19D12.9 [Aphelenchus avenae]
MAKTDPDNRIFFANYTRFVVLAITTLCLTLIIANTLALNFTIICMVDESLSNDTSVVPVAAAAEGGGPKYDISRTERSALFSAIAIGTIIGTIPITYFTSTFGVRKTFTIYGLISAVATVLTPLAASIGFIPLFGMRILQGFALSTSFPAMGAIISEWSAIKGSGMYIALLSCHLQFGPILTMPVSGEFCGSSVGWPAVYYLQGALTLLLFIAFFMFFRDSPRYHRYKFVKVQFRNCLPCRNVSAKELSKIEKGKVPTEFEKGQRQSVPYRAIFTDPCAWGIFVSNLGGMLGFQIFMQYGPIYLNKVLNFDVQNTGFAAALPYVLSALVKVFAGPFSDRFTFISEKSRVILFATLSQVLMAACFVALAFMPTDLPTLAQTCFTGATVFSGLNCVGVAKSAQMVSRQYAHVLMAINAFTNSFIILLLPAFVTLFAPNNSASEALLVVPNLRDNSNCRHRDDDLVRLDRRSGAPSVDADQWKVECKHGLDGIA